MGADLGGDDDGARNPLVRRKYRSDYAAVALVEDAVA
jgi:hypothetical protein